VVHERGFGEFLPHQIGHGVGLEIHERPFLGRHHGKLSAGMPITVEPGIYLPGRGGVRIEDTVLVSDPGYVLLTNAPRDLLEL
jgi:Xaa-Pro aminopeptidase